MGWLDGSRAPLENRKAKQLKSQKRPPKAKAKAPPKRRATDAAQHERFLETAKAVEASDEPQAFDRAFKRVARKASRSRG